jgi:hypothetical protein
LTHPHEFRKVLVRVYRLKNLKWSLYHVDEEGKRARMPELMQIIEDNAEHVLVIEEQRRKRPNAPGTSKRKHFERANQKRRRGHFEWHSPQEKSSHKKDPPSHEEGRSRGGHHDTEDSKRFTCTAPDTEPHVEPPRPTGWKPLVLVPQLVQLSEDAERKLADQRLKEWSKDQEEYTERQHQEVQRKREEAKAEHPEEEEKSELQKLLDRIEADRLRGTQRVERRETQQETARRKAKEEAESKRRREIQEKVLADLEKREQEKREEEARKQRRYQEKMEERIRLKKAREERAAKEKEKQAEKERKIEEIRASFAEKIPPCRTISWISNAVGRK